jgi:hypothetical protein
MLRLPIVTVNMDVQNGVGPAYLLEILELRRERGVKISFGAALGALVLASQACSISSPREANGCSDPKLDSWSRIKRGVQKHLDTLSL